MKKDDRYNFITMLEVEISSFTGGGYKVRYDFARRLISWNDGYMWNNNFMKSLTPAKLELIKENLPYTGLIEWMEGYNKGELAKYGNPTANPSSWRVCIKFEDGSDLVSSHTKNFPRNWTKLKEIIESTTECCFRLR
ncbi:MAG: hypothetical protein IJ757_00125 [Clostridiales bacterium]|nr:hypothetical protein [Clostridiales bacterium]